MRPKAKEFERARRSRETDEANRSTSLVAHEASEDQSALLLAAANASGLADRYAGDEILLDLCMRKLLKPGWAGKLDPVEKSFVRLAKVALGIYTPVPPAAHQFRAKNRRRSDAGATRAALTAGVETPVVPPEP